MNENASPFGTMLTALLISICMAGGVFAGALEKAENGASPNDVRRHLPELDTQEVIKDALSSEQKGDLAAALRRFRRLANKGDARGVRYLDELKSKMNPAQFADTEKTADIEDALEAMNEGRQEDYVTALRLLRPLAEQGDARAEQLLGALYYNGNGVPESAVEAVKLYRKSAEQGYARAQGNLAYLYEKGEGVLRDLVAADMWASLAAAGGEHGAADARDELEKKMTQSQIAEAERLAREWKPTTQPK
jgi:TPR repeat protein